MRMLGDLLRREQLWAAEPRGVGAGATDPQRLHDVPERVERQTHIGRQMGLRKGVPGLLPDSTGAHRRTGVHIARRPSSSGSEDGASGILHRMLISLSIWDSIYRDHCHSECRSAPNADHEPP
jgi:hypothetical protein